jgi:hypothetical protein
MIEELRANLFGPCPEQPDLWQLREMLGEIERLRVLVVSAHALNYPRGSCSCGWLPVDLRGGNANYSWGCPDDWRIEHAAHVEELLNGGAK